LILAILIDLQNPRSQALQLLHHILIAPLKNREISVVPLAASPKRRASLTYHGATDIILIAVNIIQGGD